MYLFIIDLILSDDIRIDLFKRMFPSAVIIIYFLQDYIIFFDIVWLY